MKRLLLTFGITIVACYCWAIAPGAKSDENDKVAPGRPARIPVDATKVRIEGAAERVALSRTVGLGETAPQTEQDPTEASPKTDPGKVKWHDDFETACNASRDSGKPVLLFQLMGRLDDVFC